jgi:hypothetical protein
MKQLLIVLILLPLLPVCAHAQSHRRDGNWWKDLTPSGKLNYMVGFFDGTELGNSFSYWGMAKDSGGKTTTCLSEAVKSYQDYGAKYLTNVTNDQIVDGLDAFYKDYRNRSIRVHDAVWLVANSIAGTPQNELDKMIESWRKNAANE